MPATQAEGQRIELDDGDYVVMRPMTIDDLLAFAEVEQNFGAAIRAVKAGCIEANFKNGKPLGEQEYPLFNRIAREWNRVEDEVALPPASAPPSASPSTGR